MLVDTHLLPCSVAIFQGNAEAYAITEFVVSAACFAVMPAAGVASAVKTAGAPLSRAVFAGVKTGAKEFAIDMAVGYASEHVVNPLFQNLLEDRFFQW